MVQVGRDGEAAVGGAQDVLGFPVRLERDPPLRGLDVFFLDVEVDGRFLVEEFRSLDEVQRHLYGEGSGGVV